MCTKFCVCVLVLLLSHENADFQHRTITSIFRILVHILSANVWMFRVSRVRV